MSRIINFSAGPATLPLEVLERIREDLPEYKTTGMAVMEMSHRSAPYEEIHFGAESRLRSLMGLNDDYAVLFLQGGATLQFAQVPMNLLQGGQAGYIDSGTWAHLAHEEALKYGKAEIIASSRDSGYVRLPEISPEKIAQTWDYLHLTTNNTLFGTTFHDLPELGTAPLVADMSSNILGQPYDYQRFGLIYAGAQKNLGPSGVTVVIVRKDLLRKPADFVPTLMRYDLMADKQSLYNTPPTFAIYILGLVLEWTQSLGGAAGMETRNREKSDHLYHFLENAPQYRIRADKDCRSIMNVCFSTPNPEWDNQLVNEAEAAGLSGLRGHRSVGGLRASLYNAMTLAGVEVLTEFLEDFAERYPEMGEA